MNDTTPATFDEWLETPEGEAWLASEEEAHAEIRDYADVDFLY